jgi:hypothetical protein
MSDELHIVRIHPIAQGIVSVTLVGASSIITAYTSPATLINLIALGGTVASGLSSLHAGYRLVAGAIPWIKGPTLH